ncbi:glycoside hydrolase family 88 protein [Blastopirellula sp. J2-11]|uniref:glycoside hydrolase family 88 protein n=1 Tax=Blastopirellula sp. J2-11 TaxID=2943192 RepID=UPI0021C6F2B9|nr:glycoside hydrolase family 88 protein [Blastopirellula sp. J2-11]UUO04690.1 glycoside hydrolase family 88 protein [Blastopirellula sp. J2-11]
MSKSEQAFWPGATPLILGRDDDGKSLIAWTDAQTLDPLAAGPLVFVVFDEPASEDPHGRHALQMHKTLRQKYGADVRCAMIYCEPGQKYPPLGSAYNTPDQRTAATIWRAIGWLGPDLVIECTPENIDQNDASMLWKAVTVQPVARIGTVESALVRLSETTGPAAEQTQQKVTFTWGQTPLLGKQEFSPLRTELRQRLLRTPAKCAEQLGVVYGHDLKSVMYQPALAIMARLDLAAQLDDSNATAEIEKVLEPWLKKSSAPKTSKQKGVNGSVNAGHLVFAAWAEQTGDPRAIELVRRIADQAFDAQGQPLSAMPAHNEMSDAVFMACPILTSAGRLTGEEKYLNMAQRQLRFMQKHCLRSDGLYRHSPLCEAAWGRGNGFPMLGLALAITDLEAIENDNSLVESLRSRATELKQEFLRNLRRHAEALLPHQDPTGMWRQVIDEPSAYREMTATCMIGFTLQRGIDRGWLDAERFQPAVDQAWSAVSKRCSTDGVLFDVCTGTGKMKSLQDYFDRTAILDRDERGGAMALLFAVERIRN